MSNVDIKREMSIYRDTVENYLEGVFPENSDDTTVRAARYSLMVGGKRIRPVLMLMISDMLCADREVILPFAAALEMIHTYSLIHDDLPRMDNDDLRRGMPTCHVRYGEATALLAGDLLLNSAFEIILEQAINYGAPAALAGRFIAKSAGGTGMIGGQSLDISSYSGTVTLDRLEEIQRKKTGALLTAAILTPFFTSEKHNANQDLCVALTEYASHLGLSFQIKDDILDVESSPEVLGKSIGKDAATDKATFVTVYGLDGSKNRLSQEFDSAYASIRTIESLGFDTQILTSFTDYLKGRTN